MVNAFIQWANNYHGQEDLPGLKTIIAQEKKKQVTNITDSEALSYLLTKVKSKKVTKELPPKALANLKSAAHLLRDHAIQSFVSLGFGFIGRAILAVQRRSVRSDSKDTDKKIAETLLMKYTEMNDLNMLHLLLTEVFPDLGKRDQRELLQKLVKTPAFEQFLENAAPVEGVTLKIVTDLLYDHGMLYSACQKSTRAPRTLSRQAENMIVVTLRPYIQVEEVEETENLSSISLPRDASRAVVSHKTKEMVDALLVNALAMHLPGINKHDYRAMVSHKLDASDKDSIRLIQGDIKLTEDYKLVLSSLEKLSEVITLEPSKLQKVVALAREARSEKNLAALRKHNEELQNEYDSYVVAEKHFPLLLNALPPRSDPHTADRIRELLKLPILEKNLVLLQKQMDKLHKQSNLNPVKLHKALQALKPHFPHKIDELIDRTAKAARAKDIMTLEKIYREMLSLGSVNIPTDI